MTTPANVPATPPTDTPAGGPASVSWAPVEYTDVAELRGPLVVVRGAEGVGWDEYALVHTDSGEARHGLVLETGRDLAVVQVLEGTAGIRPEGTRVVFTGSPLRVPVGEGWLGRVCNGRGEPLDGGPPVYGTAEAGVNGFPLNPTMRQPPAEPVLTGVSAIDALTTLVRGQKIAVFAAPGLPYLDLAAQIAAQAHVGGEPFSVVFAAMGLTHADAAAVRDALEERSAAGELTLLLNLADDPVIERIITPRLALTVAEHLAFGTGRHVLVVLADMTSYCEALREVSAARGEIPARRAFPGYLYSDLASLYERCGRIRGLPGSVTVLPVLTMPAGDVTHPVPDLTGYITEGQILLSRDVPVYPHIDPLSSLSRLMRAGTGRGRTRPEHMDLAAQILAALARARQTRELAELVGDSALSLTDRRYLSFADAFQDELLTQRHDEPRPLDDTFGRAWRAVSVLPRRELAMLPEEALDAHHEPHRQAHPEDSPEDRQEAHEDGHEEARAAPGHDTAAEDPGNAHANRADPGQASPGRPHPDGPHPDGTDLDGTDREHPNTAHPDTTHPNIVRQKHTDRNNMRQNAANQKEPDREDADRGKEQPS